MKPTKPNLHAAMLNFSEGLARYLEATHKLQQAAMSGARHASQVKEGAQKLQQRLPNTMGVRAG